MCTITIIYHYDIATKTVVNAYNFAQRQAILPTNCDDAFSSASKLAEEIRYCRKNSRGHAAFGGMVEVMLDLDLVLINIRYCLSIM